MVVISLQYICVSNQDIVHLKLAQCYMYANYISVKLGWRASCPQNQAKDLHTKYNTKLSDDVQNSLKEKKKLFVQ